MFSVETTDTGYIVFLSDKESDVLKFLKENYKDNFVVWVEDNKGICPYVRWINDKGEKCVKFVTESYELDDPGVQPSGWE